MNHIYPYFPFADVLILWVVWPFEVWLCITIGLWYIPSGKDFSVGQRDRVRWLPLSLV